MDKVPKISVVMTVFNGRRFIREAIDSILNQTFGDLELIIIDNASTDGTKEIVHSYADSRIVFIENRENLGQTKALNIGIKQARGEFIARMDADDISLSNRLELQHKYLQEHKEVAVVGAWYYEIDEEGRFIREFKLPVNPMQIKAYLSASSGLTYHCIPHPIVLMRKSAILDVELYDENYIAQDYDLWVRISRKFLLANINKPLFKYRICKNSQTSSLADVFDQDCRKVIMRNILHYCPDLDKARSLILMRMLNFLPQESKVEGDLVLGIFDAYFDKAMAQYICELEVKKAKNRIKMYYLPCLFFTNKVLSFVTAVKIITKQPGLLLDRKLYAKELKVFLKYRKQLKEI